MIKSIISAQRLITVQQSVHRSAAFMFGTSELFGEALQVHTMNAVAASKVKLRRAEPY